MKKILTTLAIASLSIICSCDLLNPNNDPELPPITTEGKDTFGCLVNGELFLPDAPAGFGTGVYAELQIFPDTVGFNVYAGNSTKHQNLIIFIYDTPTVQVGKVYDLTSDPVFFVKLIDPRNSSSCTYRTVINGNIKLLKFDITNPQNKIISGTFEFTASSVGCKDTVKVTEGRFDIGDVIQ